MKTQFKVVIGPSHGDLGSRQFHEVGILVQLEKDMARRERERTVLHGDRAK